MSLSNLADALLTQVVYIQQAGKQRSICLYIILLTVGELQAILVNRPRASPQERTPLATLLRLSPYFALIQTPSLLYWRVPFDNKPAAYNSVSAPL
jgi:hypothetical protein